jgi:hypothetical protein
MAEDKDTGFRMWPYVLAGLLLCGGVWWARKVEVVQRDRARSADLSLDLPMESILSDEFALIRTCADNDVCPEPDSLGFPPGNAHDTGPSDQAFWLMLADQAFPELHDFYLTTYEWNGVVRDSTLADGTVIDRPALRALLDGPLPARLSDELVQARDHAADRRDRGRLLSRAFGWGWKFCLLVLVVVPIAALVSSERRYQRMRSSAASASLDGTPGTTSTPFGPSSTNVS